MTTLYHGARESLPNQFAAEFSICKPFVGWLTPSKSYASDYGTVGKYQVSLSKVLDLRPFNRPTPHQVEKTVAEWTEIFRSLGLEIEITNEEWADVEIPVWSLWDDCDMDATRATNLREMLANSEYEAVVTWEKGANGQAAVAYGLLREGLASLTGKPKG